MICRLSRGGAVAEIDTMGAEMISYHSTGGISCLWNGDSAVWTGHSPHLFPIIGTLRDGTHHYQQRDFAMAKHGLLRNTQFVVTAQSEDAVTMLRKETKESLEQYPFEFSFFVTHTLLQHGFQTQYKIVNNSAKTLPFCVGGHPSFLCPVMRDEQFSDYEVVLHGFDSNIALLAKSDKPLARSSQAVLPIKDGVLALSHSLLGDSVLIFENTGCHQVTLRSRRTSYNAQLSFADYPNFALWTFGTKEAEFLCIEPWHGLPAMDTDASALADKPYCILLEAGKEKELNYEVHFSIPSV